MNNKKSVAGADGGELYTYSPLSPNVRVPPNAVFRFGGSTEGIETIVISSPSTSSTKAVSYTHLRAVTTMPNPTAVGASLTPITVISTVAEPDVHSPSVAVNVKASDPK